MPSCFVKLWWQFKVVFPTWHVSTKYKRINEKWGEANEGKKKLFMRSANHDV